MKLGVGRNLDEMTDQSVGVATGHLLETYDWRWEDGHLGVLVRSERISLGSRPENVSQS